MRIRRSFSGGGTAPKAINGNRLVLKPGRRDRSIPLFSGAFARKGAGEEAAPSLSVSDAGALSNTEKEEGILCWQKRRERKGFALRFG